MDQKLKVTMDKIVVTNNGDSPGRSELSWNLLADDVVVSSLSPGSPRRTGDGDTIILGDSATVNKSGNSTLMISGNVTDDDGFLKGADDVVLLNQVYTKAANWGIGSHNVRKTDGKRLDVTVFYTIAKA